MPVLSITYVDGYLGRHGLQGAAVAIAHEGEVVSTAGHGGSHEGLSMTPGTVLAVGSLSKLITASAVLQLVEAGKIQLDDPVVQHLPQFELADTRVSEITIRHLLSHTSGIPSPIFIAPADDLRQGVERLQDWQLEVTPGVHYRYSNMNYHVAARLVENVAEMPFAEYLHEHLFEPLNMDDTRSVNTASDPGWSPGTSPLTAWPLPCQSANNCLQVRWGAYLR